jgi:hypothetical protein
VNVTIIGVVPTTVAATITAIVAGIGLQATLGKMRPLHIPLLLHHHHHHHLHHLHNNNHTLHSLKFLLQEVMRNRTKPA